MTSCSTICEAQAAATIQLAAIAREHGEGSGLLAHCEEMWRRLEAEALVSVRHGDLENALAILRRGVQVLADAGEAARNEELPVDDLALLLRAV
ncbi:hypothetical protein [Anaeromyxobacter oryzae]|uniref:Uncharacterized protein n=1 Tax=Anaeromyxobacter oryzae TaxID=2918170 RepID=A0ABM7WY32_9BACT|nr:hypothetical protein [Anaeromyxobacter oryzae]BDG04441.1 hypothetical protein AMOR_34370 [Anaeromyxobacter oryzae]